MTMNTARQQTASSITAPDDFLSDAFGYPCRALTLPCDLDLLAAELAGFSAPAFVWTKVTGRDDAAFATMTDMGFRIAVEEITYERPADDVSLSAPRSDGVTVRKVAPDENAIVDAVGALAAANMTTSRFHQDALIPDAVAADIKKQWAMNYFTGTRGQEMYIATAADGRIVGFNQVLVTPDGKVIDLICTATDFRRRGVARALVEAMFAPGIKTRVGSQANNAAADAFYKSLGFVPVGASICLHWHAGKRGDA